MKGIKLLLILLSLIMILQLSACGYKQSEQTNEINGATTEEEKKNIEEKDNKENITDTELEENRQIEEKKEGISSPLSGMYGPEERVNRRPVAVIFDNHRRARWQAGLRQAEIVYEFLVEGNITRYLGLFLINDPELIGPIRSARPYFITTTLEYDAVFVRCGGSEQAKRDVKELKLADIDGLASEKNVFWRYYDTGKKIPNNLYSSIDIIRRTQKNRGYRLTGDFEPFKFHEKEMNIQGDEANIVIIKYSSSNSTKYVYDSEEKVYKRYKDDKLHVDELDNEPLVAKNILIQEANTKVIDNEGRLEIDLIGKGEGKYITNGKVIDIKWEKKDRHSKTRFYENGNNELVLNPGITWIQVVKPNTMITVE